LQYIVSFNYNNTGGIFYLNSIPEDLKSLKAMWGAKVETEIAV
jgi:hypothetical protein